MKLRWRQASPSSHVYERGGLTAAVVQFDQGGIPQRPWYMRVKGVGIWYFPTLYGAKKEVERLVRQHDVARVLKYEARGHHYVCAARMVWGDGECVCSEPDLVFCRPSLASMVVEQQAQALRAARTKED